MKLYFQNDFIKLYHGDSREAAALIPDGKISLITDPVWPNAIRSLAGSDSLGRLRHHPQELLAEMFQAHKALDIQRAAIHLGTDSDPRFLSPVPPSLKFFRTATLRYCCPGKKGQLLQGNDSAYLFGSLQKAARNSISFQEIAMRLWQAERQHIPALESWYTCNGW